MEFLNSHEEIFIVSTNRKSHTWEFRTLSNKRVVCLSQHSIVRVTNRARFNMCYNPIVPWTSVVSSVLGNASYEVPKYF